MIKMKINIKENISDKYVYHNSPEPDITIFVPRTIWRNEDWSESGGTENPEFEKEDVVYALDKEKVIFYSLPRDVQRILVLKSKTFLLPSKEKQNIENHSWTEYKFLKKDFEQIPTGEWIARKSVKPISKNSYKNPLSFLVKTGYKIKWVDDLQKSADNLRRKNIIFDSENL